MNYSNAWNCKKCPRSNEENGCPAWIEYVQENPSTGEQKFAKECLFKALPVFLIEVLKASNRPAAAIESTRNEIVRGFEGIQAGLQAIPGALPGVLQHMLTHNGQE